MRTMARGGEEGVSEVRRRKRRKRPKPEGEKEQGDARGTSEPSSHVRSAEKVESERQAPEREVQLESGSYWLTRIVFIRALGFVYCNSHQLREYTHCINSLSALQLWHFW